MAHSTLGKKARRNRKAMTIHHGPRPASIQFILGYSRALKVVDAPPIGTIALVLN